MSSFHINQVILYQWWWAVPSLRSQECATTAGLWFSCWKFELILLVKKWLDKVVSWRKSSIILTVNGKKMSFSMLKGMMSRLHEKSPLSCHVLAGWTIPASIFVFLEIKDLLTQWLRCSICSPVVSCSSKVRREKKKKGKKKMQWTEI